MRLKLRVPDVWPATLLFGPRDAYAVPLSVEERPPFIYHRFRQINDNLIEAFIHLVDQYEKQAKLASEASAIKP